MALRARAVVEAVFLAGGSIGSAQTVARRLGLASRFKLARLLRREGLPPLHVLAEWATLLSWVVAAERDGASLCRMAFRSGRHPSACYRLVKDVTGMCWARVRILGAAWVQQQFLKTFENRVADTGHPRRRPNGVRARREILRSTADRKRPIAKSYVTS